MNTESQQLLQSALTLPETDRAQIAASLIHSLDDEPIDSKPREDVDAAWAEEIKRRIESIDNGEVKLIAWDQVMREMSDRCFSHSKVQLAFWPMILDNHRGWCLFGCAQNGARFQTSLQPRNET